MIREWGNATVVRSAWVSGLYVAAASIALDRYRPGNRATRRCQQGGARTPRYKAITACRRVSFNSPPSRARTLSISKASITEVDGIASTSASNAP